MLALKIANWITRKIDQTTWERSGYQKAMLDQLKANNESIGAAKQAVEEAKKATPEERRESLKND